MASSVTAARKKVVKLGYDRVSTACSYCRRLKRRCVRGTEARCENCQHLRRIDCYFGHKEENHSSVIKDLLEKYPVISVSELYGPDTDGRTYSDLRIIVTAIAQSSLKGQPEKLAEKSARKSYSRLCSWKTHESSVLWARSVPRIQVLSLVLLFEENLGLSDLSTRDELQRACQVMLKNDFSSSLLADEWHNPGLFDVWIILSAAILLLNETDKEVTILERYFDLPYPPAYQLEQRFGNIGTATQYTQRVQSMHERYLPLQVETRQGAALRASEPRPLWPI